MKGSASRLSVRRGTVILAFLVLFGLFATGCRVVQSTAALPSKAVTAVKQPGKAEVDTVQLQQQLLRFHDDFGGRMVAAADQLRRGTNQLNPTELQEWKLAYAGNSMAIASGPNAYITLLDSIVFVTLTRKTIEDYWKPKVFGESANETLKICAEAEQRIWLLAAPILKEKEQAELRAAIQSWYEKNPDPNLVLHTRAIGFAAQIEASNANPGGPKEPTTVFNLLRLDPLSGLDPATRELAQTRLFAERALFVAQRMPVLLRWQLEVLTANTAALPEIQTLVTNSTQLANSAERFGHLADQFPSLVNAQREATIKQIFDSLARERTNLIATLDARQEKLQGTLHELRQTMEAGDGMAKSVDAAVKSLDTFVGRFDQPGPRQPADTNARPFDVLDYAKAASEVATAAKELNATVAAMDQTLPRVNQVTDSAINKLFVRGFILIVVLLIGSLVTVLVHRRLTKPPASIPHNDPNVRGIH